MKRNKTKRLAIVTPAIDVGGFPRGKIILFSVPRITTRKRSRIAVDTVLATTVPVAVLVAINTNLKLEKTLRHQTNINTAKVVATGMMLLVG